MTFLRGVVKKLWDDLLLLRRKSLETMQAERRGHGSDS